MQLVSMLVVMEKSHLRLELMPQPELITLLIKNNAMVFKVARILRASLYLVGLALSIILHLLNHVCRLAEIMQTIQVRFVMMATT